MSNLWTTVEVSVLIFCSIWIAVFVGLGVLTVVAEVRARRSDWISHADLIVYPERNEPPLGSRFDPP